MLSELKPAILITIVFTMLTGILYPLAVTGVAQLAFPHQANGSLVARERQGHRLQLIGAELHQAGIFPPAPFGCRRQRLRPDFFQRVQPRPYQSRAGRPPQERRRAVPQGQSRFHRPDPRRRHHYFWQRARSRDQSRQRDGAIGARRQSPECGAGPCRGTDQRAYTQGRQFGFLGEPRVNVLEAELGAGPGLTVSAT